MARINPDLFDAVSGLLAYGAPLRSLTALVYPPAGFDLTDPPEVFTVGQNEIATYQIELGASVTSVQQPVPVKTISNVWLVPDVSCYVVTDSEHKKVAPDIWRNAGGHVQVTVNPDTTSATVTIRGAALPGRAPYMIGFDDGATTYGSLFVLGTGIGFRKRTITLLTGLSEDIVADDSTAELDNAFLQTQEQAWDAAHEALCRRLGNFQTIGFTTTGVEVDGDETVDPQAPETAFGKVAGARVIYDGAYYRVRSAQITESSIAMTAEQDTTFGDFAAAMPDGITFDQLSALWPEGATFADFTSDPLNGGDLG